ncbi:MAG: O-antigen ligase family protein [Vampirovibrio sp.]|nr:O-antigen ligase family protein [Vampirovibrio sp.]
MTATQHSQKPSDSLSPEGMLGISPTIMNLLFWGGIIFIGLLAPLVAYVLLPAFGIHTLEYLFSIKKMGAMVTLGLGGVVYLYYLSYILPRPHLLVFFNMILWLLVEYCSELLLINAGVNLHLRPILFLAMGAPSLWILLKHWTVLFKQIPHFKYYLLFFTWVTAYFFFYNSNASDAWGANSDTLTGGSVAIIQMEAYFYCFVAIPIAAIGILKHKEPFRWFDTLNKALMVITSLVALAVIAGYPSGLYSMNLDGFTRAFGLFSHPNPYSHHMGLLLVYLLGLFFYYQSNPSKTIPKWLLLGSLAVNFIAFILGFSKTGIGVFLLCALMMSLMSGSLQNVSKQLINILLLTILVVPLGIFLFEILSGQSFWEMLEARINDRKSFNWRTEVWGYLLAQIEGFWILVGHGFTAGNVTVFQFTYNNASNAKPLIMVHNGYIALLYDFGIMGYSLFAAAVSVGLHGMKTFLTSTSNTAVKIASRPLSVAMIALTVYYLVVCYFDEMTYMFDAARLYWLFATTLLSLTVVHHQSNSKNAPLAETQHS